MPKVRNLKKDIASKRQQLHRLVNEHGVGHPAVIALSAELDQALNLYYRVRLLSRRK